MKIKLALLDKDSNYLNRIVTMFNVRYADKIEVYSFTELAAAIHTLSSSTIDVLLASEAFEIDEKTLPTHCALAYFVESPSIETLRGKPAICKFQKLEMIFKGILSIYAETSSRSAKFRLDDNASRTVLFASAGGGVGSSTIAAACAVALARQNRRVLFLDLERFGDASSFFTGDGSFTLSDVIYAIKGHKANVSLKLESAVKQDASGVYFFAAPEVALDVMDLTTEDIQRLMNELRISGLYDDILVSSDFDFSEKSFLLWRESTKVVMVSDGSEVCNVKFDRMYKALQIIAQQDTSLQLDKMQVLYNKFSNKTSKTMAGLPLLAIGGIPRFEHATTPQVIEQVSRMEIANKIVSEKEL